jgi:hypothetical protein
MVGVRNNITTIRTRSEWSPKNSPDKKIIQEILGNEIFFGSLPIFGGA